MGYVQGIAAKQSWLLPYKERMKQTGETQILETDPERRSMKTKEGMLPSDNIQTVADDDSHIIVSFETTNVHTDQGQRVRWLKKQKRTETENSRV